MGQEDAGFRLTESNAAEIGVRIRSKKATRRMLIDAREGCRGAGVIRGSEAEKEVCVSLSRYFAQKSRRRNFREALYMDMLIG